VLLSCFQLKRKELAALEGEVQEKNTTLGALEADAASLQHAINSTLYDKQRGLERLASIQVRVFSIVQSHYPSMALVTMCGTGCISVQRMANRYDAVNRGRRAPMTEEEAQSVWERHQQAQEEHERIRQMIEGLSEAHPGLSEVLVRVSQLLDS
jgi:hypothetical protein